MDNPNPIALTAETIKKQDELRRGKTGLSTADLWTPDWKTFFVDSVAASSIASDPAASYVAPSSINSEHPVTDPVDAEEVFDLIRHLTDPEHPFTLEQLSVVSPDLITVDLSRSHVKVNFTPTIPHCSQATLIGLMIRVKLFRCLSPKFKVDVQITPGSHNTEAVINKQLNDKERVAAALENPAVLRVINRGVADSDDLNWAII